MKEVNFWDTNYYKENYKTITKDILKGEIRKGNHNLIILDSLYPNQTPLLNHTIYAALEQKITQMQLIINYTNENHQILKENKPNGKLIINSEFLSQNKEEILKAYYSTLTKKENCYITIEEALFDNDRFNKLIQTNTSAFYKLDIISQNLSEENKQYLKSNFIKCSTNDKQISSKYVIGNYTLQDLKQKSSLILKPKDVLANNNLIYIKSNTIIELEDSKDEQKNFEAYSHLLSTLEANQLKATVIINEELIPNKLSQIDLENIKFKYVKVKISSFLSLYSCKRYNLQNNYLETIIKNIKNSRFSPFEKYMQLYKIIDRFKPKKDSNNPYFTKFLSAIMLKADIKNIIIDSDKILFYLEDDKYNISGYYVALTRFDYYQKDQIYPFSAITFRELNKKEKIDVNLNCIFNVTNMTEFSQKINQLIDKKIIQKQELVRTPTELSLKNEKGHQKHARLQEQVEKNAIVEIFDYTTEIFRKLDYKTYLTIAKKYAYLKYVSAPLKDYYDFLTTLGIYITNHTNNRIYEEHKLTAAVCTKIKNSNKHERLEIKNIIQNAK